MSNLFNLFNRKTQNGFPSFVFIRLSVLGKAIATPFVSKFPCAGARTEERRRRRGRLAYNSWTEPESRSKPKSESKTRPGPGHSNKIEIAVDTVISRRKTSTDFIEVFLDDFRNLNSHGISLRNTCHLADGAGRKKTASSPERIAHSITIIMTLA
ncbi:hypothetical protein EVAR_22931_1 [Eumeta japonica]|uniref:Uncharacterized protein n=1 Tax=Eumeta variegata TaxID=151549 RepID=A0A4C1UUQ5_EUMVA|nr:hypothetical protein EVAR_22931_1 [Eumeta japonica]